MPFKKPISTLFAAMALIVLFVVICDGKILSFGVIDRQSIDVSFLELATKPEAYHGKQIRLVGVMRLEFEGDAIYLCKDHYTYRIVSNAFRIFLSPLLEKKYETIKMLNGKYVALEGVFNNGGKRYKGLHIGTIENINRIIDYEAIFKKGG